VPVKREPWLAPDQEVPGAGKIVSLLHARPGCQIHSDSADARILVAKPALMDCWTSHLLADPDQVKEIVAAEGRLKYFVSPPKSKLAPLLSRDLLPNLAVATELAVAFRKSRKLDPDTSFARALYSEHFGTVLPVPRIPPDLKDDEMDFGTWLCEGLAVSAKSFTQLANIVSFMPPFQLAKVLRIAGFDVPEAFRAGADSRGPGRSGGGRSGADGGQRDSRDGGTAGRPGQRRGGPADKDGILPTLRDQSGERLPEGMDDWETRDWDREKGDRPGYRDGRGPRPGTRDRDRLPRRAYGPDEDKIFKLPGRRELQKFFNDHIVEIILSPDKYKKLGIDFPAATILHGPPGCGKTYAVDRLVEFIEWPVNHINSSSVASPYIHDTSRKISQVFDKAIKNAPSVLVIDEMESYLASRQMSNVHQHQVEEVGEFLRRIPDALDKRVLIIAMTNMIDTIDNAILRQGRFDYKVKIELPDRDEVKELMDHLIGTRSVAKDLDITPAIDALVRKPLSDATFVMREAARLAAKAGLEAIDNASLLQAIKNIPPATGKKEIGFLA
jgi:hypothetical protein